MRIWISFFDYLFDYFYYYNFRYIYILNRFCVIKNEGGVAALRVLVLLRGFRSAPRILELLPGFRSKMWKFINFQESQNGQFSNCSFFLHFCVTPLIDINRSEMLGFKKIQNWTMVSATMSKRSIFYIDNMYIYFMPWVASF